MNRRWLILAVLFTARTAVGYQYQSVAAVSPYLMVDVGIDYGQYGVLLGLYFLPGIVLALPGGFLGRRFGDKRVVVAGLGMMVAGGLAMALGSSYAMLVAGRLLSGSGAILLNVLVAKMVADWFVERGIVTAMAILVTSWPLGIGLALVTLPLLAEAASWQAAMVLTAIFGLVGLALVALVYRAPPSTSDEGAAPQTRTRFAWTEVILVLLAGLVWALFNVALAIIPGFAPGLLVASGYTVVAASSMVSIVSWLLLLSLPAGGYLAERIGRPNLVLVACFLGIGLCSMLLALWPYPAPTLVALGLLFGPPAGIIMSLPAEVLPPERRATGMGLFFTCYYTGMPSLTVLAGFSLDTSGSPAAPLLLGGLLMVFAIAVLALFRTMQRSIA
jgi:MFS family permease